MSWVGRVDYYGGCACLDESVQSFHSQCADVFTVPGSHGGVLSRTDEQYNFICSVGGGDEGQWLGCCCCCDGHGVVVFDCAFVTTTRHPPSLYIYICIYGRVVWGPPQFGVGSSSSHRQRWPSPS